MENLNRKSMPLIKQRSHSRQSSEEHFVLEIDVLDHHENFKQECTDSGQFSLPGIGHQSPLQSSSPESVTFPQSSGCDPKRIPPSIFSTRPATPMEWSIASNESLFSINLGSWSFSKENFFMLYESGELTKVEDPPGKSAKPDESNKVQPSSPSTLETDPGRHTRRREMFKGETEKRPLTWCFQEQPQSCLSERPPFHRSQSKEHLRPQSQPPPKTSSNTGWFSCITCWSRRTSMKRQLKN